MRFFLLNSESFFIRGALKSTIYNTDNGKIVIIDPELKKIIEKNMDGIPLSKILEYKKNTTNVNNELEKLKKMGIGDFFNRFYKIEKVYSHTSRKKLKKRYEQPRLKSLSLDLNNQCNLNCYFCKKNTYVLNRTCGCKRWPVSIKRKKESMLSREQWKRIIDDAKSMYCKKLIFVGGEPLLNKNDLIYLIQYSNDIGFDNIKVYTNGQFFDRELINIFNNYKINLIIQIYSHINEFTDSITRVDGTHKRLLRNLNDLKNKDIRIKLKLIILKKYWSHYEATIEFYKKYNPQIIIQDKIYPRPYLKYSDNIDEYDRNLFLKSSRDIIRNGFSKNIFLDACEANPCFDCKLFVSERGYISPCPMARRDIIGNIREKNLRQIIRDGDSEKYWNLNRDNIEICKDCEFRYFCYYCLPFEKSNNQNQKINKRNVYCTYDPIKGEWEN